MRNVQLLIPICVDAVSIIVPDYVNYIHRSIYYTLIYNLHAYINAIMYISIIILIQFEGFV